MIEVNVESIRVSLINQNRLVVLREVESPRYLAIWIGPFEAEAITIGIKGTEIDRPMTHDLLRQAIELLGATIKRVQVNNLADDTFFARIVLERDGEELEIDSRPSDAIALAVRAKVPIFIAEEVMETAGQLPAEGEPVDDEAPRPKTRKRSSDKSGDDALALFRDFVEGLEIDESGSESKGGKDPEADD